MGSFVAVVFALLGYLLLHGFSGSFIILAGILILVQIIFGNILEPKISGDKLNLSPTLILLSLLIWAWVWGIIGMILAVPITATIKIILSNIKSTKKLAKLMS